MASRRPSIPLSAAEEDLLKHLYLEFRIPIDQYKRRPDEKRRFVAIWNNLADRNDPAEEVIRFMMNRRKNKKWPTLDGNHLRLERMPDDFLSDEEWKALEAAYEEVVVSGDHGSDAIFLERDVAKELGKAFASRVGRVVSPLLLSAALEVKRKRGEWLKLPKQKRRRGWSDMDEAAG